MAAFTFNADAPVFVPSYRQGPHDEDPKLQTAEAEAPAPPAQSLPEPSAANNLDLTVVSLDGSKLARLQVPSSLPVAELKSLIADLVGVVVDGQILVASSSVLEDGATLEMQGVEGSATLTMLFKPHRNVVFLGHVDAGKTTTCSMIMSLSDTILQKEEESTSGRAALANQAHCATSRTRFTIFDTTRPGCRWQHSTSQQHIAVLVVSARRGEFETCVRGGGIHDHANHALVIGVQSLIVAINKMDDANVGWQQTRYVEIVQELEPFVSSLGFKRNRCTFIPISGLTGVNIKESGDMLSWYDGETLMDTLDSHAMLDLNSTSALRLSMLDGFQQRGVPMACGMVEQGAVSPHTECLIMPTKRKCSIDSVYVDGQQVSSAKCGENVTLTMLGVTEEELKRGYILCPLHDPLKAVSKFRAQLKIFELPEEKPVMTAGYRCMIHMHTAIQECEVRRLEQNLDTQELRPLFVRGGSVVTCLISTAQPIAAEISVRRLRYFALRDEGRTIARGRIIQFPKEKTDNSASRTSSSSPSGPRTSMGRASCLGSSSKA